MMQNSSSVPSSIPRRTRTRWVDWWLPAALLLALSQAALYVVLHARPGMLGVVLWYVAPWALGLLALGVLAIGVIWSAIRRPFWSHVRGFGFALLAAVILVSGGAYRVYPSSYDRRPSAVRFRLPLDGAVTVAWGGAAAADNYHVVAPDQRWAYDLLVLENSLSYRESGLRLEDYFVYGQPVRSPAAGRVVRSVDGRPDEPIGTKWKGEGVLGNHVVVQVAEGEFLFVAHLQRGSVVVQAGDLVDAGQTLGRAGNSGKSSEPHVHLHLQDTPTVHFGEGIPMYFYRYRVGDSVVVRGMPTGGIEGGRFVGLVVEQLW